jgi:hypothetical protein
MHAPQVSFSISGVPITVLPQPQFLYSGAYIASCVPNNALTTGRQMVRIIVMSLGTRPGPAEVPFVSLGGSLIDQQDVTIEAGESALVIRAMTPVVPMSQEGDAPIIVTLSRTGLPNVTISSANVFRFISPPAPFILTSSLSVEGHRELEAPWASIRLTSKLSFTTRFLFLHQSATLEVYFGDHQGHDVVYESTGSSIDVRLAVTRVSVMTPIDTDEGMVALRVRLNGTLLAETQPIFDFRDLAKPAIVAVCVLCTHRDLQNNWHWMTCYPIFFLYRRTTTGKPLK